jgi:hypothetical protein
VTTGGRAVGRSGAKDVTLRATGPRGPGFNMFHDLVYYGKVIGFRPPRLRCASVRGDNTPAVRPTDRLTPRPPAPHA